MKNHALQTSLAPLADAFRAAAEAERQADIRKANNLRRSRSIAKIKPNTGPRIAR